MRRRSLSRSKSKKEAPSWTYPNINHYPAALLLTEVSTALQYGYVDFCHPMCTPHNAVPCSNSVVRLQAIRIVHEILVGYEQRALVLILLDLPV
jgi:hypothetical protein